MISLRLSLPEMSSLSLQMALLNVLQLVGVTWSQSYDFLIYSYNASVVVG
jgi:hypothetical protein